MRVLVVESGQDPAALDGIVLLGDIQYTPSTVSEISNARRSYDVSQNLQSFMDSQVLPAKFGLLSAEDTFEHMQSPDTGISYSLDKRATVFDYNGLEVIEYLCAWWLILLSLHRFNLPNYVTKAFQSLTVTVDLVSVLHIGNFTTNLAYSQNGVPAYTDSSLVVSSIHCSTLNSISLISWF